MAIRTERERDIVMLWFQTEVSDTEVKFEVNDTLSYSAIVNENQEDLDLAEDAAAAVSSRYGFMSLSWFIYLISN